MSVTRLLALSGLGLVALLCLVVDLAARRENSRIPTLGDMCAFVMRYRAGRVPVGRIALYGFWWWVGWHFFAR